MALSRHAVLSLSWNVQYIITVITQGKLSRESLYWIHWSSHVTLSLKNVAKLRVYVCYLNGTTGDLNHRGWVTHRLVKVKHDCHTRKRDPFLSTFYQWAHHIMRNGPMLVEVIYKQKLMTPVKEMIILWVAMPWEKQDEVRRTSNNTNTTTRVKPRRFGRFDKMHRLRPRNLDESS